MVMRVLAFDFETTGFPLKPVNTQPIELQPYATQLAASIVEYNDDCSEWSIKGTISSNFSDVIKAGLSIPWQITKLTGIKDSDLVGAPTWADFRGKFFDAVYSVDYICAHNFPFDAQITWLSELRLGFSKPFTNVKQRCTLEASRRLGHSSNKLSDCFFRATGQQLTDAHRADNDTAALIAVYLDLYKQGAWSA